MATYRERRAAAVHARGQAELARAAVPRLRVKLDRLRCVAAATEEALAEAERAAEQAERAAEQAEIEGARPFDHLTPRRVAPSPEVVVTPVTAAGRGHAHYSGE